VSIDAILAEVVAERERQDARWGAPAERGYGAETWLAILGEEAGEVCREIAEATGGGHPRGTGHLRHELVQVAAVCGAWAEALVPAGRRLFPDLTGKEALRFFHAPRLPALMNEVGCLADLLEASAPDSVSVHLLLQRVAGIAVRWAAALEPDTKEVPTDA